MKKAMVMEEEAIMEAVMECKSIEMRAGEAAPHMRSHAAMETAAKAWTTDHAAAHTTAAKMCAAATHAATKMPAAHAAAMTAERRRDTRRNRRDA